MKTLKTIFASLILITFATVNVNAQAEAEATARAAATIIQPITIENTRDLNFGDIAVNSTSGGTVVLPTTGERSSTGGVTLPATTGTVTSARFIVTGVDGYAFSIQLPNSITLSGTGDPMTVSSIVSTPSANGTINGETEILVGATLEVNANQTPGLYENTEDLTVTVDYN